MFRVLLVSDQPALLGGFRHVLANSDFEVIANWPPGDTVAQTPDLVLVDVTSGLTLGELRSVTAGLPGCPVVLWSDSLPLDSLFQALEFGVRGIVRRSSTGEQLAETLRRVANGEMQIGFGVAQGAAVRERQVSLTPREKEIVTLLRRGLRNKEIGAEMNITEGTVKIYLFRLFQKLGVKNRFELARSNAVERSGGQLRAVGSTPLAVCQ